MTKSKYIALLSAFLLCFAFFADFRVKNVNAEEIENTFSLNYDYDGKGSISDMGFYAYDNVIKDVGGNAEFGLIPADAWGASVNAGDGFFVYEIKAENQKLLNSLVLSFNAYYGCANMSLYYGSAKTNVIVSVGSDGKDFTAVFDLFGGKNYKDILSATVTGTPSSGLQTGDSSETTDNVYGNKSCTMEYTADLTEYVGGKKRVYVRFDFVHMSYEEVKQENGTDPEITYPVYFKDGKTALQGMGIRMHNVKFNGGQGEIDETGKTIYSESIDIDYDKISAEEWSKTGYETAGLNLVKNVDYGDGKGKYNVLGCLNTNSDGYIVYKFAATDGKTFAGADIESFARLFDYNLKLVKEKLDYYISYDNDEYILAYSSHITKNYRGVNTQINLDKYVFGRTQFYLKVAIGCSNDTTWTNLKNLKVDIKYETVNVKVKFGDITENIEIEKGGKIDLTEINVPDGIVLTGDYYYIDENGDEQVFDADLPIENDKEIYCKIEEDKYLIEYELNGGTDGGQNPTTYTEEDGAEISAPTKQGYIFAGWYTDENFKEAFYGLKKGTTGDIKLYAKWVEDKTKSFDIPNEELESKSGCKGSLNYAGIISVTVITALIALYGAKRIGKKSDSE